MWSDLLGFGSAFKDGLWSFNNESTKKNIDRLRRLEHSLHRSNDPRKEVAFVLNDGLARVYDLPIIGIDSLEFLWWFHFTVSNHWIANAADMQYGSPGMRSVLTFGERIGSWRGHTTYGDHFLGNTKLKKIADQKICIYSPDEFQLNLAFSKAYLIETAGSKAGLSGPALFIDLLALDAIKNYFEGKEFDFLKPLDAIDHGEYGKLPFSHIKVSYDISLIQSDKHIRFEIKRLQEKQLVNLLALEFEVEPIKFDKHGIYTELLKVRKYYPIDTDESFCFDFENYSFKN